MAIKKQPITNRPAARCERLLVEGVDDETVIYDLDSRVAHALKPLAAAVFSFADGNHTTAEIADLTTHRLNQPFTESDVVAALGQLDSLSLLQAEPESNGSWLDVGVSRRTALKTFAAVGAGSLLITSVAAAGTNAQTAAGEDQLCGVGSSSYIKPTSGGYVDCYFPAPGVTSVDQVATGNSGSGYGAHGAFAGEAAAYYPYTPNVTYGEQCNYVTRTGQLLTGEWQCVPCDGGAPYEYQCCQVVCAPAGLGYNWGPNASRPAPATAGFTPYGGDGFDPPRGSGGTQPQSPDYAGANYYGKYCTSDPCNYSGGHCHSA